MRFIPLIILALLVLYLQQLNQRIVALEGDADQLFDYVDEKVKVINAVDYRVSELEFALGR